jgi:tetratricopeptide (TPR) repeat protein
VTGTWSPAPAGADRQRSARWAERAAGLADAATGRAEELLDLGRRAGAARAYRRALRLRAAALAADPTDDHEVGWADDCYDLARCVQAGRDPGGHDEVVALYRRAMGVYERWEARGRTDLRRMLVNAGAWIGDACMAVQDWRGAAEAYLAAGRRCAVWRTAPVGQVHSSAMVAALLREGATALACQGRWREAETVLDEALAHARAAIDGAPGEMVLDDWLDLVLVLGNIGVTRHRRGSAEAERWYSEAAETAREALAVHAGCPLCGGALAVVLTDHGLLLAGRGDPTRAYGMLDEADRLFNGLPHFRTEEVARWRLARAALGRPRPEPPDAPVRGEHYPVVLRAGDSP